MVLRIRLQFLKDHRGNLLRRVGLAVDLHLVIRAHMSLDRRNSSLRIGHSLTLGDVANQAVLISKSNDRRRGAAAFGIGNALGVLSLHDIDAGVRGSQIDANNFGHISISSSDESCLLEY